MFIFSDSSSQSNWNGWEESTMNACREVGKCFREFPWKTCLNISSSDSRRGECLLEKYFSKWKGGWASGNAFPNEKFSCVHSTQLIRFSPINLQVKLWKESNNSSRALRSSLFDSHRLPLFIFKHSAMTNSLVLGESEDSSNCRSSLNERQSERAFWELSYGFRNDYSFCHLCIAFEGAST